MTSQSCLEQACEERLTLLLTYSQDLYELCLALSKATRRPRGGAPPRRAAPCLLPYEYRGCSYNATRSFGSGSRTLRT
jgi:hypothetical protein